MVDWTALRNQFPITLRWAFFDHAAVAPLSVPAVRAITEWAQDTAENGDVNAARWEKRVEEVRDLASKVLGAAKDDVAFIKNTSEGIGIVAEGLPWKPGDNVVTAAEEYPANIYPWMNLENRGVMFWPNSRSRLPATRSVTSMLSSRSSRDDRSQRWLPVIAVPVCDRAAGTSRRSQCPRRAAQVRNSRTLHAPGPVVSQSSISAWRQPGSVVPRAPSQLRRVMWVDCDVSH